MRLTNSLFAHRLRAWQACRAITVATHYLATGLVTIETFDLVLGGWGKTSWLEMPNHCTRGSGAMVLSHLHRILG
jgi:hypothetical protein